MQQYTIGAATTTEGETVVAIAFNAFIQTAMFTPDQADALAAQLKKHAVSAREHIAGKRKKMT